METQIELWREYLQYIDKLNKPIALHNKKLIEQSDKKYKIAYEKAEAEKIVIQNKEEELIHEREILIAENKKKWFWNRTSIEKINNYIMQRRLHFDFVVCYPIRYIPILKEYHTPTYEDFLTWLSR